MLTPPSSPYESYRRADLRLRTLLFGDESSTPGVIRGGEEARLRVRAELRRMRQAVDELAAAQERTGPDLAEELRRLASARSLAHDPALLTPAEAARALGVSVSTIYRAVRVGDVGAVRLAGKKRGGMRIPASEVDRLMKDSTA
jgi:excisionase family DNA binding protein